LRGGAEKSECGEGVLHLVRRERERAKKVWWVWCVVEGIWELVGRLE
jgi:hypothetical protein